LIDEIEQAPAQLRQAVSGLSSAQLDTRYRDWTIRQIAYHLADSHVNSYVRFKLTLTEDNPTIKPYKEGLWSALDDARHGDIEIALQLFDAIHARWLPSLRQMTPEQFARTFFHPESGESLSLDVALGYYAWHGRHHIGQILWLRNQHQF
jgi:uncharacterized damage-inducible protein DinB